MVIIRKKDFVAIFIVLFVVCRYFDSTFPLGYYDEFVGLLASLYVIYLLLTRRLLYKDQYIAILLILITFIGLISNIFSQLISNFFAIGVDIVWLWKTFATFIAFKYLAMSNDGSDDIICFLYPLAKICILVTFALSIIAEVIDIGLTKDVVILGLRQFGLFDINSIQTGWFLFSCIAIVALVDNSRREFLKYLFFATIPLLLTFSSLVYCWLICEYGLIFILREGMTFRKRYIVILGGCVTAASYSEIQKYLLSDAIRSYMIKYGIITANSYFPLGSGFATFGSEMAHRYYSKLYIKYGFNNIWGLSQDNDYFMNDNFFATIIAQYGWIGFALYLLILAIIFSEMNTNKLTRYARITGISIVITMAVAMIASGSPKSMMGVFQFAILGIVAAKAELSQEGVDDDSVELE